MDQIPAAEAVNASDRPGWAWYACVLPLFAVCVYVGHFAPLIVVLVNQRLKVTVWTAAVGFLLAAIGAECASTGSFRWWIRPLVWGFAIGAVGQLVRLISIGWQIDLSM